MAKTQILGTDIPSLKLDHEEKIANTELTQQQREEINFQLTWSNQAVIPFHLLIPGIDPGTSAALSLCAANRDTKGLAIRPMVAAIEGNVEYDYKNYVAKHTLQQMAQQLDAEVSNYDSRLHIGREFRVDPLKLASAIKLIYELLDITSKELPLLDPLTVITLDKEVQEWKLKALTTYSRIILLWVHYSPQSKNRKTESKEETYRALAEEFGIDPTHIDWDEEWDLEEAAQQVAEAIQETNSTVEVAQEDLDLEPRSTNSPYDSLHRESYGTGVVGSGGEISERLSGSPVSVFEGMVSVPTDAVQTYLMRYPSTLVNTFRDAVLGGAAPVIYPNYCAVTPVGNESPIYVRTRDVAQMALMSNPGMNLLQESDILDALHQAVSGFSVLQSMDDLARVMSSHNFFPLAYQRSGRSPRLTAIGGSGTTFFSCTSRLRKLVASKLPNVVEVDLTSCYTSLMVAKFDMPELRKLLGVDSFWESLFNQVVNKIPSKRLQRELRAVEFSNMKKLLKPMWYATTFMGGAPAYMEAYEDCLKNNYVSHSRHDQSRINKAFREVPAVKEMRNVFRTFGEELMEQAKANNNRIRFDNGDVLAIDPNSHKAMATALSYYFQSYEESIISYLTVKCWGTARVILSQADGAWLYLLSPTGLDDARQAVAGACEFMLGDKDALGLDVVVQGAMGYM